MQLIGGILTPFPFFAMKNGSLFFQWVDKGLAREVAVMVAAKKPGISRLFVSSQCAFYVQGQHISDSHRQSFSQLPGPVF